jgi:hypothetical protein
MTEAKKHPGIFGANAPGRGEREKCGVLVYRVFVLYSKKFIYC